MKVEAIMIRDVKTAKIDDVVLRAAEIMNKYEIGCIIVTEKEKPVGILTERDIMKRVVYQKKDPAKTKICEVMSQPLIAVKPSSSIKSALKIILNKNVKKLAVENNGHLVGVISLTDLVPLLELEDFSLKDAPKHVRKIFSIYYDPKRQIRKNCPLTMASGMAISCLGLKCMWYVTDRCVFLNLVEKISS